MANLKYMVLLICFAQILYYSAADNSTSVVGSIVDHILPDCFFGAQTISFYLYTRNIPDGIVVTAENVTNSNVLEENISSHTIIFLVHGFTSSANNSHYQKMTEALLDKENVTIFSVDWKDGACSNGLSLIDLTMYYKAVENTRTVGQFAAKFIKTLVDKRNATVSKMTAIGHSLGAHVVGFTSKEMEKLKLEKFPQIIGLDPASPLYSLNDCSERLCISDAKYVLIVHTTRMFGVTESIGHVDCFMNKGRAQPGCRGNPVCSHSRAVEYITESIKHECCYIGTPWTNYFFTQPISKCTKDTCICVGLNARDSPARGKFYVEIEHDSPYCNNNGTMF